tara:strand:+ start:1040 stop:1216 length:177 start_codon:yes stop_codon:yes gene_type:complete
MESIVDLIATDSSSTKVADDIKDALYTKAAERVEGIRPNVADSMFAEPEEDSQPDGEE